MGREIIWISARSRTHERISKVLSSGQITPIEERGHIEEEIACGRARGAETSIRFILARYNFCLWGTAEIKCAVDRDGCTRITSAVVGLEQALRQAQAQVAACAEPTDGDTSAVCLVNRERLII
jgi:hypothetical protein